MKKVNSVKSFSNLRNVQEQTFDFSCACVSFCTVHCSQLISCFSPVSEILESEKIIPKSRNHQDNLKMQEKVSEFSKVS